MSLISGCDDVKSEDEFYKNAESYWKSIPANLNGMLGGYERISNIDIRSSQLFIKDFLRVSKAVANVLKKNLFHALFFLIQIFLIFWNIEFDLFCNSSKYFQIILKLVFS